LRQDMAYYDVNDMAGQAIILSTNGSKYKSKSWCIAHSAYRTLTVRSYRIVAYICLVTLAHLMLLLTLRTHLFLTEGVGRKLAESAQFFTTFCGALVYAFYADWRTSLAVLSVAPFMILSVLFLLKMNTSQTARANATYAKAGSIVSTAVSSIRTVLALDAVEKVIDLYQSATTEAYEGAVSEIWLVGLANGSNMASFLLSYIVVTLFVFSLRQCPRYGL
jgi:ABC-type multidrug transport system fused ATPase/permease subunit